MVERPTGPADLPDEGPVAEEEIRYPDGRIEHPSVRYEGIGLGLRWLIGTLVVLIGIGVLDTYLLWRFLWREEEAAQATKSSPYPLAPLVPQPPATVPRGPVLEQIKRNEGMSSVNVYQREATKEEALESYGPTDEPGYVRVPIHEAIDALAGQLPVRKQSPPSGETKDAGLVDAGESNSGRMLRSPQGGAARPNRPAPGGAP